MDFEFDRRCVPIYEDILAVFNHYQVSTKKTWVNAAIRILYRRFGKSISKNWNYDFFADTFNQEFFLKNFLKNLFLLDFMFKSGHIFKSDIIDVGCGAAPASIAYYKFLQTIYQNTFVPHVELIDKSYRQLQIAQYFCKIIPIEIRSTHRSEFQFDTDFGNSMVIFSYFICEQERGFIKSLYNYKRNFKHGFFVVDYEYIVDRIKNIFESNGDKGIHLANFHVNLPCSMSDRTNNGEIYVCGCYYECQG